MAMRAGVAVPPAPALKASHLVEVQVLATGSCRAADHGHAGRRDDATSSNNEGFAFGRGAGADHQLMLGSGSWPCWKAWSWPPAPTVKASSQVVVQVLATGSCRAAAHGHAGRRDDATGSNNEGLRNWLKVILPHFGITPGSGSWPCWKT